MQNYSVDHDFQNTSIVYDIPSWCRLFLAVYISGVFVAGLPGNALVIIVQTKLKQKSSTDWFVLALALCDVVSLVVNLPVYFLSFTSLWKFIGTTVGCKLHTFIHFQTYVASAFFFALIGVDRYTKICRPHYVYFTPPRAKRASFLIVVISTLLTFHHFFVSGLDINGKCVFQRYESAMSGIEQVIGCLIIVTVTVLVLVSYALVYRRMRRLRKTVPSVLLSNLPKSTVSNTGKVHSGSKGLTRREERPGKTQATFLCGTSQENGNEIHALELKTKGGSSSGTTIESKDEQQHQHTQYSASSFVSFTKEEQENYTDTCLTNMSINNTSRCKDEHNDAIAKIQSQDINDENNTNVGIISRDSRTITTTNTMAVASILYVICTLVPSIMSAIWTSRGVKQTQTSTVVFLFLRLLYCVNLFINPYFYIAMSSRFRKRALEIIRGVC